jgi:hypothetical protein
MPLAQDRKASLKAFTPSYSAHSINHFKELTAQALRWAVDPAEADSLPQAIDGNPQARSYKVFRAFEASGTWFTFGHLSTASPKLSGSFVAQVTARFSGDALDQLSVTLVLYNPQFVVSERGFRPATIGADYHYAVQGTGETVGLRLLLTETKDGKTDEGALYAELTQGVPLVPPVPAGNWQPIAPGALRARIDISTAWKRNGKDFPSDGTGAIATVGATATGVSRTVFLFWSPDENVTFSGVLHESDRFGLCPTDVRGYLTGISLVLGDHGAIGSSGPLTKAKQEFGLGSDFRGVIFGGLGAHWLDDGLMGADITSSASSAAVSFHEPPIGNSPARLYASVSAKIDPTNRASYLSLLKSGAQLKLTLAGRKLRLCSLSVTLKDISDADNPFAWLSNRKAMITLISVGTGDASAREDYKLDIALDAVERGRLTTLTAASTGLDPVTFSYVASVLTLAPVLKLAGGRVQSNASGPVDRIRFVEIAVGDLSGALFAATALKGHWFFEEAIHADELRVTGIRLLSQPTPSGRETALLFDVETDFTVDSPNLELKASKAVSVRVENTGLLQSGGKVRWVQASQGTLELKILDASAWSFGGFGGLLSVKKIGFQLADAAFLDVTLGLSVNLGIVSADDFKVTLNLTSPGKDIQFYPSKFSINMAAVTGEGTLDLGPPGHAMDEVAGSLDLTFLSGLRMSGAVQFIKVEGNGRGGGEEEFTAFAAGARVEWPSPVPLASSGLSIKGLDALYTSHLKRRESNVAGIPPALEWLQRANGDVAIGAVSNKTLWQTDYDRWSFGVGALLVPNAADTLLSFNTMILVELPGPKILGVMKVNFLEDAKSNADKAKTDKLTRGILGVLEIDFVTNRLRAGASIQATIADVLSLTGTIDAEWEMGSISHWHYFIGHFRRPNQVKLTLSDFLSVGATGYLMVAGDKIEAIPAGSAGNKDLPGLALAMGATAYVTLGSGSLYLRMMMQMFLNLSLGKNIYAAGEVELSGELYIYIGGIGTSGRLGFQYYDDGSNVYVCLSGDLCGHIRIGFSKVGGCVSATIGDAVPNKIAIPALTSNVSIVSGTNVALFGQGAVSPVDAILASLPANDAAGAKGIPVDSVIAISLECAPALGSAKGFLGKLQPASDRTEFNYGQKRGGYVLTDATLSTVGTNGTLTSIKHGDADAVWWRNAQQPGDGHAVPMALALLTRSPFGTPNAVASPETIARWIDALTSATGVCNTLPPQVSLNLFPTRWVSGTDTGTRREWQLRARFRATEVEDLLAASPHETLVVAVEERRGYGTPQDPAPGFPRFPGEVRFEQLPHGREAISVLALTEFPRVTELPANMLVLRCAGMAPVPGSSGTIVSILIASSDVSDMDAQDLKVRCVAASGAAIAVVADLDAGATSADTFHENAKMWQSAVDSAVALSEIPSYGALQFARLTIALRDEKLWDKKDPPAELFVQLHSGSIADAPATIFVTACKYLSIEEFRRHTIQKDYNDGIIKELEAYLSPRPAPVLEPSRDYQLQLTWRTQGSGIIANTSTEIYAFTTDVDPPRDLAPYLLGTFPRGDARFHPPGQQFGFSLSSGDILKILAKFRGAELKITVTEDGNNPVTRTIGRQTLDWVAGRRYRPEDLLDLAAEPVGLNRKPFRALPSALLRALKAAMASGKLSCISKTIPLDDGMWLGIEADLEPLRGYTVTVDIVDHKGDPWRRTAAIDKPFLRWHFQTGLHRDITAHAAAFARPARRSRALQAGAFKDKQAFLKALDAVATPVLASEEFRDSDLAGGAPPVLSDRLSIIEDQVLEDLLTSATGARPTLEDETETLFIWSGSIEKSECVAVALRSKEPISRRTRSVHVRKETKGATSAEVLHLEEVTTRYPHLASSKGAERLFLSTSGTTIVVILDRAAVDAAGALSVAVKDLPPYYLPYADAETVADLVKIAATEFAR